MLCYNLFCIKYWRWSLQVNFKNQRLNGCIDIWCDFREEKTFSIILTNLVYMTNTSFEMTNVSNLTSRISLMLHLKIKFSLFTRILIMLPYFSDSRVSNFSWHSILTWIKVISISFITYKLFTDLLLFASTLSFASYCFYPFHSNSFIICSTIIILLHLVSQGIQFRVFTDRNT